MTKEAETVNANFLKKKKTRGRRRKKPRITIPLSDVACQNRKMKEFPDGSFILIEHFLTPQECSKIETHIEILGRSKSIKKQHDFKELIEGVSMNIGIVSQLCLGVPCLHPHTNVQKCLSAQDDLLSIIFPKLKKVIDENFEDGCKGFMRLYKEASPDIPCLMCEDQGMPWNGIQLHWNVLCKKHCDHNDIENVPTITVYVGKESSRIRHWNDGSNNFKEYIAPLGSVSLMDSQCPHEILPIDPNASSVHTTDGHCRHHQNRSSLVLMATKQSAAYVSTAFMSKAASRESLKRKGAVGNSRFENAKKKRKVEN